MSRLPVPIVSLFCGPGGMDLGFFQKGFRPVLALDDNQTAVETCSFNISHSEETIRERLSEQDPTEETRNRFRLRRISEHADYEPRVDPWRVFYRVQDETVTVELIGRKKGNVLLIEGKEFKL